MHLLASAALVLLAGADARDLRAREDAVQTTPDPAFSTPKFRTVPYEDILKKLQALADEKPDSVSLVAGLGNVIKNVKEAAKPVVDSTVPYHIPNPMEESPPNKRDLKSRQSGGCTNPSIVKEWNSMAASDKTNYVNAVKCMMGKPSRSGLPGAKNLWDDLAAIHQQMTPTIHGVGQFLPWHRYFMWVYEQELRKTCGYQGPMTWWDETKNAGNFNGAAPFTTSYYGHMPDGNQVCIISGVFANTQLHIGPGSSETNHCLSRGCNEQLSASVTSNYVNSCNSFNDYASMQDCSDGGPHAYGHNAIGGNMGDVQSSVGDPAFFLHHAFIDRNWRIWQRTNPTARTYAIGGSATPNCGNCAPTTLSYQLDMKGFQPTITVDQVMDTQGGFLCYHYDY